MKSSVDRCTVDRGFGLVSVLIATMILASAQGAFCDQVSQKKEAFRELQLGYVALDQRDFDEAMAHYARARDLALGDEQLFNALFGLGSAALEIERLEEARGALDGARKLRPDDVRVTFMLGVVCRRQGELDDAVAYLAEAVVRDSEMTQAYVELGIAYGAMERHIDAERVCREAVKIDPESIEARLGLAVALFHQDKNKEAIVEFRGILEIEPDNLRAHYGLGLALFLTGDREGAIAEIVYLNPRAPGLAKELAGWVYPEG